MAVGVDESSGGGDRLGEEMAVSLMYVVAVSPQVPLSNKRFRKSDAVVKSELTSGNVIGVYVG